MNNSVFMKINQPALPEGATIQSTDWRMNTKPDFSGHMIISSDNDTVDKLEKTAPYTFDDSNIVYGKVRLHILHNGVVTDTDWSDTMLLTPNSAMVTSDVSVYAPRITIKSFNLNDTRKSMIDVVLTPPAFFKGSAGHVATDWALKDLAGNVLWERLRDRDNKLDISINLKRFENINGMYVEARYVFDRTVLTPSSKQFFILRNDGADFSIDTTMLAIGTHAKVGIVDTTHIINKIDYWIIDEETGVQLASGSSNDKNLDIDTSKAAGYENAVLYVEMHTNNAGTIRKHMDIGFIQQADGFPFDIPTPLT